MRVSTKRQTPYRIVISWIITRPCFSVHLQWQVDGVQGDVGRMLCRNVPGHCHHTHGDAQDPDAGCWQAR